MSKRIVIDPVTRVEGHGKVTLLLDEQQKVTQARLHIVEFRGFEKFIQGRPYWELPLVVQRLCGICPVSHHLAAAKAIDQIVGVDALTPAATALRRLMHFGQVLQSHALHFFHLASPDLLFGFDSDVSKRNIVAVIQEHKNLALKGVKIRKYGQQVIEAIAGKRIHGIAAVAGGMNTPLTKEKIAELNLEIKQIIQWCQQTVELCQQLFESNWGFHKNFGYIESPSLSLIGEKGELELYDGNLRVIDTKGNRLYDQFPYDHYSDLLQEQVKSWSYMKFPFLKPLTPETGWYRVGPLARLNTCSFINTPLAEAARLNYFSRLGKPAQSPLAFHWARMIEALHCAEAIEILLSNPDLTSDELMQMGTLQEEGIGVIEAPRGTLFHHYQIDQDQKVVKANLIVSTTSNNQAMNETIRQVAHQHLDGTEITPNLLNLIEVAIRAYDPCLSCATHATGKMPLVIETWDHNGQIAHRLARSSNGQLQ